jgi:hypothetical protein
MNVEREPHRPHERSGTAEEFKELVGVQEFRSSGVQEFRSSGVQEFRSGGDHKLQDKAAFLTMRQDRALDYAHLSSELLELLELPVLLLPGCRKSAEL